VLRDPGRRLLEEGGTVAKKRKKDTKASQAALPVMRPDAAGIDIGATEIFVAVPACCGPWSGNSGGLTGR
jgi:hypothetical protein